MGCTERELAKVEGSDIWVEDHGIPIWDGTFHYEGGCAQGVSYMLDMAFIMRLMAVFGVDRLSRIDGKSCWVTHTHDKIISIEPLHKKEGTPFVIQDWIDWQEANPALSTSAYELRTGKKP